MRNFFGYAKRTFFSQNRDRFWEIDALRGLAILSMIVFHTYFDVIVIKNLHINPNVGFFSAFQKFSSNTFIFLSGVSLSIGFVQKFAPISAYVKRGAFIYGIATLLSFTTHMLSPECYIHFGILHFFGCAIMLCYLFGNLCFWNLPIGIALILLGKYLNKLNAPDDFFMIWGYSSKTINHLDYFPILPNLGTVLLGLFVGEHLYKVDKRTFRFINKPNFFLVSFLTYIGSRSLFIYITHQLVIIPIVIVLNFFNSGELVFNLS